MDVFGRIAARAPDDDLLAVLVPFEDGAGTDAEPAPDLGGNRDLSLRGQA